MKLRYLILLLVAVLSVLPSHAVLKEDSLGSTLVILRSELSAFHDDYGQKQKQVKEQGQRVFATLVQTMQNSSQNALMLYSQKDAYVFDLSYACHEAIKQYSDFKEKLIPFNSYVETSNSELARFDSLIASLRSMPIRLLDERAKIDRNICLALAVNTRRMVQEDRDQLNEYITYYKMTESRLKYLSDYANEKYEQIQNNIFKNGSENYFTILSKFSYYWQQAQKSISDKYTVADGVHSQWDSKYIVGLFIAILFYALVSVILNQLVFRLIITRLLRRERWKGKLQSFMEKRTCLMLASTAVTFAIILGFIHLFSSQNFLLMASSLLVQFAWLMSVIIISTLLRVESKKAMKTIFIYLPLLVNCFLVITFRVVLIPSALVNIIFPPILLVCCLWQGIQLKRMRNAVGRSDRTYATISQIIFIGSLVCSMLGYSLLSVQILIWWVMQLTCILTITCVRDWYKAYVTRKELYKRPVTETWLHSAIYWVLLPLAGVFSAVLSLYWATEVFNLSDITMHVISDEFISAPNFTASILDISIVVSMWFIFNYLNHTAKAFAKYWLELRSKENAAQRFMMLKNVMQIFVWGVWFIASLSVFNVSSTWIVVVSGGLSTGIGFASKDILENIYYGISLMLGRIKIGDLIICDDVRGTVSSISYTSTTIDTVDGSVIAFQNSQLFSKNYKNLTRNHGYEMHVLEVGVAYGTKIEKARQLIRDAILTLDCINKKKGVAVVLKELGDSALVLKVIVWVNVFTQYSDDGIILEKIYNTLNENNIEIPFPQTDVHLR